MKMAWNDSGPKKIFENAARFFKNDRRREGKNDPNLNSVDAEVTCCHCGKRNLLWGSAWVKPGNDGDKWISVSFRHKDKQPEAEQSAPQGKSSLGEHQRSFETSPSKGSWEDRNKGGALDDEIPF
jgi:hypothetical protein